MPEHQLDLLGEVCPVPLFRTQEKLEQLAIGEVLIVNTDFTRSVRNILNWCSKMGHDIRVEEEGPCLWKLILIKKS